MVPAELPAGAALLLGAPHTHTDRLARTLSHSTGVLCDGDPVPPQGIRFYEPLPSPQASRPLHAPCP